MRSPSVRNAGLSPGFGHLMHYRIYRRRAAAGAKNAAASRAARRSEYGGVCGRRTGQRSRVNSVTLHCPVANVCWKRKR